MKTEDLIAVLARDQVVTATPTRLLVRTLPVAVLAAFVLLLATLGLRADLLQVLSQPRIAFKLLVTLSLAIPALLLLPRVAIPLPRAGPWRRALWLAPLVLLAGVLVELIVLPGDLWMTAAQGRNAVWCLTMVPLLAVAPLAATLYSLRQAAPARPERAGALAGLVSGGFAAAIYALHCTDDSPLFVALWYTLGVLFVSGLGAWLATRLARW